MVVDPKGGVLSQVGYFLQKKKGYKIKVFNSIDFSKSMHYNPLAYIRNEADKKKNAFDLSRLIRRRMDKLNPSEEYTVYEVDVPDGGHMEEDEARG